MFQLSVLNDFTFWIKKKSYVKKVIINQLTTSKSVLQGRRYNVPTRRSGRDSHHAVNAENMQKNNPDDHRNISEQSEDH